MPVVRKRTATFVAGVDQDIDLGVFNRFGGRGGQLSVTAAKEAAATGVVTMSVQVGSDMVAQDVVIGQEPAANVGPDAQTQPVIPAFGAPGDPILVRIKSTTSVGNAVVQANINNL